MNQTTLRIIGHDDHDVVKRCFTDMLTEWLKMIDPKPSWEGLIAALKQPSVGHKDVAKAVEKEIGKSVEYDDTDEACLSKQYKAAISLLKMGCKCTPPELYIPYVCMVIFPYMGMLLWKHTEGGVHLHPIFNSKICSYSYQVLTLNF